MQKLKKALKKLAHLGKPKAATKSAQPAKKAPTSKKKSQPVAAAKKAAGKKAAPAKKPVAAKVSAAAKAPKGKVAKADQPKKKAAAPAAPPAKSKAAAVPAKAVEKTAEKKDKLRKAEAAVVEAPKAKKSSEKETAPAPQPEADVEAKLKAKGKADAKAAKARRIQEEERAEQEPEQEVVLTDAEGRRYCRVKDCDQIATVDSYCRYHYLLFWKNIQSRKKILSEGKLERYIEDLTARYPDKYLELLKKDLRSEKEFMAAIQELEIDESGVDNEFEDEAQSFLDEVRGMGSESGSEREEDF
jgi:hypothetical protein